MDNIISTSFKKVLKLSTSLTFASLASCSVLLLLPFKNVKTLKLFSTKTFAIP